MNPASADLASAAPNSATDCFTPTRVACAEFDCVPTPGAAEQHSEAPYPLAKPRIRADWCFDPRRTDAAAHNSIYAQSIPHHSCTGVPFLQRCPMSHDEPGEVVQRPNDEASTGRHRISRSRPSLPSLLPVFDSAFRPVRQARHASDVWPCQILTAKRSNRRQQRRTSHSLGRRVPRTRFNRPITTHPVFESCFHHFDDIRRTKLPYLRPPSTTSRWPTWAAQCGITWRLMANYRRTRS
jgi:hypothetical protein